MKTLSVALMYAAFFGLIGFVCWVTKSPWPLLALFLTPSYSYKDGEDS